MEFAISIIDQSKKKKIHLNLFTPQFYPLEWQIIATILSFNSSFVPSIIFVRIVKIEKKEWWRKEKNVKRGAKIRTHIVAELFALRPPPPLP